MDQRQAIILVVVFLLVFWGMGAAVYFSRQQGPLDAGGDTATRPRFTARAGTTREKAVALTSSRREAGVDTYENGGPDRHERYDDLAVQSLSRPQEEFARDMARQVIDRTLRDATPAQALDRIRDALEAAQSPAAKAQFHLALGALYLDADETDTARAVAEFDEAIAVASAPGARLQAALRKAETLRAAGEGPGALDTLEHALEAVEGRPKDAEATAHLLHVLILVGDLHDDADNPPAAETAYGRAVDAALRGGVTHDAETRDALRLAGMRLVRLFRAQGRHDDAERIGRRVRSRLSSLQQSIQP